MKKKYEKPVMVSEEFAIGNHIAHGGCNHKPGEGPMIEVKVHCERGWFDGSHKYWITGKTIKNHEDYDSLLGGTHSCDKGTHTKIGEPYHVYKIWDKNPHPNKPCNPFSS